MSISKFQDKFLSQKGCSTAIALGTAFIMSFFIFSSCSKGMMGGDPTAAAGPMDIVVSIGDVSITSTRISDTATRMMQGQLAPTYGDQADSQARVFGMLISDAALQFIGRRDHLFSDAATLKAAMEVVNQQLESMKMQIRQMKPNATPKEIDDIFKAQAGKTPAEALKSSEESLKKDLADKDKRSSIEGMAAPALVREAMTAKLIPSQKEVDDYFLTDVVKKISFTQKPGADPAAKAKAALAAIKGGMSFEAAMDKFSDEKPLDKKKKPSEVTTTLGGQMLSAFPAYKPLLGQKAGFVSDVIDEFGSKSIIKIVSSKVDVPKDFESNKARYFQAIEGPKLQEAFKKELDTVLNSSEVKWSNAGYKALHHFNTAAQLTDPAKQQAEYPKVVAEAKEARKNPTDSLAATYAWYEAFNAIYNDPKADKTKLRDDRVELLNAVLDSSEDYDLRMELVKLYTEKKDGKNAAANLAQASGDNTMYDHSGQKRFGDVAAERMKLATAHVATDEELKAVDAAQASWRKNKADVDKQEADMKVQEAAAAKLAKENDKKNAELLKKQQDEAKKNISKAGPSTTAGSTTTGSGPSKPSTTATTGSSLLPQSMQPKGH